MERVPLPDHQAYMHLDEYLALPRLHQILPDVGRLLRQQEVASCSTGRRLRSGAVVVSLVIKWAVLPALRYGSAIGDLTS